MGQKRGRRHRHKHAQPIHVNQALVEILTPDQRGTGLKDAFKVASLLTIAN
ncbi:MAG: hypothetical protein WAL75_25800 [Terracidiphilus sp.]